MAIPKLTESEKIIRVASGFKLIMETLGLDTKDASLKDTPLRVAKMYVKEICGGLVAEPPKLTSFPNPGYSQMVVVKDINVSSLCEHHFVPFIGKCHIAYIPGKSVVGLSKFSRTVQHFSAKPQVQERLTHEVASYLIKGLKNEDVAVVMECKHLCCGIRGAKDPDAITVSAAINGKFVEQAVREEFYKLIGK